MLCPVCGTNVGDTQSLCEKCQAERDQSAAAAGAEAQGGGSALGSIRPNLKIVRLNKTAEPAGDASAEAAQSADAGEAERTETPRPPRQPISRGTLGFIAAILLLSCFGLAGYLFKDQIIALAGSLTPKTQESDSSNLKQIIQIRVRPDATDLQSRSKFGYAIAGYSGYAFRMATAKYSKKTSILTLELYTEFAKPGEPEMRVDFEFAENVSELSLDKLLHFDTYILCEGEMTSFNKVYSPKAIGLDVVPRLRGTFGSQPVIKLQFNGSEFKNIGSGGTDFSWKLVINMPMEVVP